MKSTKRIGMLFGFTLLLSLLAGCGARATTVQVNPVVPRYTVKELTREARAVVIGTVQQSLGVSRVTEPEERTDRLYTDYEFLVEESLKGPYQPGDRVVLRLTGGQDGDLTVIVPTEYSFAGGERTLLFLAKETGPNDEAYILTAHQGIFDIERKTGAVKARMPHLGLMQMEQIKTDVDEAVGE